MFIAKVMDLIWKVQEKSGWNQLRSGCRLNLLVYFTIHMLLVLAGSRISASKSMTGSTNRSLENQWQDQAFAAAHQAFEAQDGDVLVRWKCEMVMV